MGKSAKPIDQSNGFFLLFLLGLLFLALKCATCLDGLVAKGKCTGGQIHAEKRACTKRLAWWWACSGAFRLTDWAKSPRPMESDLKW